MIDRGISENYVLSWLELSEENERFYVDRIDRALDVARHIARRGGRRSLVELYQQGLSMFGYSETLAAEFLRRALTELADPTPIDDSLPPPESRQWEDVRASVTYFDSYARPKPPLRSARPPRSSR